MFTTISPVTPSAQPGIDASCPSPRTVRVAVVGEIDLSTSDVLRARLLKVLSAPHPDRIEVDLAGVTFLDCSGLTVLVALGQAAARTGCRLRITNPHPIVRRVLDLTGLLDILTAGFDQAPAAAATDVNGVGPLPGRRPIPSHRLPPACPPIHRWTGRPASYQFL